ncbi:UbiA prenyltransferase family protein [Succinivibrio dextrinosolvens]|uniref:UbiA prenyltransferase family protein n=1 Tax=Succinivibrio dextrinosolvens TaxID=83771 RepID=UPI0019211117|nr:UbiA prenyltransferase family protein [Succinivibrio dextrinosolvens]
MNKYIRIMRPDHWIKQLFIVPGFIFAFVLLKPEINNCLVLNFVLGFIATCLIASSNYIINEWLDAEFDKFHPTKKHRSVVENNLKPAIVYSMYFGTALLGGIISYCVSPVFFYVEMFLWIMGVIYNVRPIRSKDIPFLDVISESVNNAIRLLIGWFVVTASYFPPVSIIIGYWLAGAFLMAIKRYAEYRMINDPKIAGLYRKSFKFYSEKSLLLSALYYAMSSILFVGIFLIKYRIELILFMPIFIGLFCYYFLISFKEDSAAQKPEKLFREKGLMLYCLILCILFLALMTVDIPIINFLVNNKLVEINY